MKTKDDTIKELKDKLDKQATESMSWDPSKHGAEDMWRLGLTNDQMSAVDGIIEGWRQGYNRKDQELYEVWPNLHCCDHVKPPDWLRLQLLMVDT
eukprot:scaffold136283_cov50-Prasinocladus_malaysianus.AAC.1